MTLPLQNDAQDGPLVAMAFAENLAKSYTSTGGNVTDLFVAFVGIVVNQNKAVGLDALKATDRHLGKTR